MEIYFEALLSIQEYRERRLKIFEIKAGENGYGPLGEKKDKSVILLSWRGKVPHFTL